MATRTQRKVLNRRQFLKQGAAVAGLVRCVLPASSPAAETKTGANPFAYDVTRLSKTDPKLIQYQEVSRFRAPHEDPRRITVGPDDRLYVAAGRYVSILDPAGVPISEVALDAVARCLAVSRAGEIFVGLKEHLELFDRKGQRRATWDSPAPRTWFTAIAISADSVFAADAGQRVVLRYDLAGKVIGRIGEKNKERNIPGFIVPSPYFDVKMHPDGLLRVTNPGRHRVEAYTVQGDLEFVWGQASTRIDGFCGCCNPVALELLGDGRVITCEKGLPRVKIYRTDGSFESVVAGPESFPENAKISSADTLSDGSRGGLDAAVDSKGRIYVLDRIGGDVRVFQRRQS